MASRDSSASTLIERRYRDAVLTSARWWPRLELVRPGGKLVAVFVVTALLGHVGQRFFSNGQIPGIHPPSVPATPAAPVFSTHSILPGNEGGAVTQFIARMTEMDLSSAVGRATATVWVARAAASDPVKTFEYLRSHDWEKLPRGVKETFFNVWAGMDPDAAVAAMTALPAGALRKDAECHLFHAMCEQQPVRALDMMLANGEKLIRELNYASSLNPYYSTFFNMALKDPELAKQNLERVPAEFREQTLQGITRSLARSDLPAAVRFAMSAGDGAATRLLTTALQEGLMNQSDQAWPLLQSSLSGLGGMDKKAILRALTQEILKERPQEGFDLMLSAAADDKERRETETMIFQTLAWNHPTLALQLIAGRYPDGPDEARNPGAEDLFPTGPYIQALAKTDPAALVDYLAKHPSTTVDFVTERILWQAGKNDPAGMMEMLTAEGVSPSRQKTGANFLMKWSEWDPLAASQWQADHGTGNTVLETAWQEKIMLEAIQKTPEIVALDFLKETTASPEALSRVSMIAFLWSVKDPQAAADWATQLPVTDLGETAVNAISHQWIEQDSVAASKWISNLPPGKPRHRAIQNLIAAIQKTDPDSAKQWQESLDSENPDVKKP